MTVHSKVSLGLNQNLSKHIILGQPARGDSPGDIGLTIGNNCLIRSHTIIYAGNQIGDNFQTGHHVVIREDNIIGNNVSIGTGTIIEHHIKIGNNVRIHSGAFIPEYSVLEDDVWIGPKVILTNARYPHSSKTKEFLAGPFIKTGAMIGANATILPGVCIGEGALVGAGSVVTKDVPAETVVAGCPAKFVSYIDDLKHPDGEKVY